MRMECYTELHNYTVEVNKSDSNCLPFVLSSRLLSKSVKIKIYSTIILFVVWFGHGIWSVPLREGYRFRVLVTRVLVTMVLVTRVLVTRVLVTRVVTRVLVTRVLVTRVLVTRVLVTRVLRKILGDEWDVMMGDGGKFIIGSYMVCTLYRLLFGSSGQGE